MLLVFISILIHCISCELVVVSGVYPDPENAPKTFSSSNKPYFSLQQTPIFNRVVTARMYHNGYWVLKDKWGVTQTPYKVGSALANLKPTFVHGLLFKQPGSNFSDQEIAGYIAVRNAVLTTSPFCKFSIEIDAVDYFSNGVKPLLYLLSDIKNKSTIYPDFKIDAIHMDHWNQAYSNNTSIGDYLIQFMHEKMNLIVGGNTYGGSVPAFTDYIGLTTTHFQIPTQSQGPFPSIGLITNSNPLDASSEACAFLNFTLFKKASTFNVVSSGNDRIEIIRPLGSGTFYSFAWPIFAPLCPSQKAYDAILDNSTVDGSSSVYEWIQRNGMKGTANVSPWNLTINEDLLVKTIPNDKSPNSPQKENAVLKTNSWIVYFGFMITLLFI